MPLGSRRVRDGRTAGCPLGLGRVPCHKTNRLNPPSDSVLRPASQPVAHALPNISRPRPGSCLPDRGLGPAGGWGQAAVGRDHPPRTCPHRGGRRTRRIRRPRLLIAAVVAGGLFSRRRIIVTTKSDPVPWPGSSREAMRPDEANMCTHSASTNADTSSPSRPTQAARPRGCWESLAARCSAGSIGACSQAIGCPGQRKDRSHLHRPLATAPPPRLATRGSAIASGGCDSEVLVRFCEQHAPDFGHCLDKFAGRGSRPVDQFLRNRRSLARLQGRLGFPAARAYARGCQPLTPPHPASARPPSSHIGCDFLVRRSRCDRAERGPRKGGFQCSHMAPLTKRSN